MEYSPPRDGGQFDMPEICLSRYPILGEMTYLKMQSVNILSALNELRVKHGQLPVAIGPINQEMKKIDIARKSYQESSEGMNMHNFIVAFNKLNRFSMVAYPVGMHNDHFRNGESLENKILFTIPLPKCRSLGRGGSIVGNRYVYALLDW